VVDPDFGSPANGSVVVEERAGTSMVPMPSKATVSVSWVASGP
jgi:hypothetical protein